MTKKSVLIILAAAVVLASAVLAAGCISYQPSDDIVGIWVAGDETDGHAAIFYDDGTGDYSHMIADESADEQSSYSGYSTSEESFTWKKNADGTYTTSFLSGDYICTLDSAAGTLTVDDGLVYTRAINAASGATLANLPALFYYTYITMIPEVVR